MSNNKGEMFLEALLELKEKTRGTRGICYHEVLLNLYFDLGGRLPLAIKERLKPTYFNKEEIEEILYILVIKRIRQLIEEEQFNEYLLINMMANRVSQVLATGYQQLLLVEERTGAKGYKTSKTATIKDFREGYEVQIWWDSIKLKLIKKHIRVIAMSYDKLYYALRAREDYAYLKL